MRWWLLPLILVAVGCAWAARPESQAHLGYADWNCSESAPESYVRARLVLSDPVFAYAVAAHEVDHENYMVQKGGTCRGWRRMVNDSIRVDMEARAFCASVQVLVDNRRFPTIEAGARFFSHWLVAYPSAKSRNLTEQGAFDAIMGHCTE
jgi:hypothetical protein